MYDKIGAAEHRARIEPQNLAELRNYLRMEFGLGTEPGFLLREATEGARRPRGRVRKTLRKVVHALAKAMGARPANNGRRPGGGSAQTTG